MGIDASIIFNTAINLNSGTIEKYLIEEQKKSSFSPQVFFDLLLSHTKKISISKEIEYLNGKVLELTYDLKNFDEEVAPTLSDLSREYNRTKKTKKLEEAKAKATNYELFHEIVNRQLEQDSLISGTSKANKNLKKTKPSRIIINSDIVNKLFDGLKQYFEGKEEELKKVLTGKAISEKLIWPLNQNQLSDLFLRLLANGFIQNNKTELTNWLVENFTLVDKGLNTTSIYQVLTRKFKTSKRNRILENLAPNKPESK